jgi:hypothetical protein
MGVLTTTADYHSERLCGLNSILGLDASIGGLIDLVLGLRATTAPHIGEVEIGLTVAKILGSDS